MEASTVFDGCLVKLGITEARRSKQRHSYKNRSPNIIMNSKTHHRHLQDRLSFCAGFQSTSVWWTIRTLCQFTSSVRIAGNTPNVDEAVSLSWTRSTVLPR